MKLLVVPGSMINLLAGLLSVDLLYNTSDEHVKFWGSKIDSKESSISKVLNIENMKNMIAEEISYINFNVSETDDIIDDTTLRKTHMRTYVVTYRI
ncbi:hypothetical protein G9A89_009028 [Geosiphon pyriformis]|nr:hypothetical protein G9A89_009028 [Geosiphon pyriformis]